MRLLPPNRLPWAVLATAVVVPDALLLGADGGSEGTLAVLVAAAAIVVAWAALLFGDRNPVAAVLAVAGAALASGIAGQAGLFYAAGLAVFELARSRPPAVVAGPAALALVALVGPRVVDSGGSATAMGSRVALIACALAAICAIGEATRQRRRYVEELEARARSLEAERTAQAARAVAEERGRIARDLHDVLAHGLTLIAVRSGATRDALDAARLDDPVASAGEALGQAERAARAALMDLRGVVRGLDAGSNGTAETLQISFDTLPELVERVRGAGLDVGLRLDVEPGDVAAVLEASACRIVQEALTNVLRHARAERASVRVTRAGDELTIDVRDDGIGPGAAREPGRGLLSMRERAAVHRGSLEVAAGPRGGTRVLARLPLKDAS